MKKESFKLGIILLVSLLYLSFISILPEKKTEFKMVSKSLLDTCINPLKVTRNTPVGSESPIIDEGCQEVDLDEGFETADGADYTAQIGNGNINGTALPILASNSGNERINLLIKPNSGVVKLRWIPERPSDWYYTGVNGYQILREEFNGTSWVASSGFPVNRNGINPSGSDYSSWSASFGSDNAYYIAYYTIVERGSNALSEDLFFNYYSASTAYNICFDCAIKSGHGFNDSTITAGKRYRYKITGNLGSSTIDSGNWLEVTTNPSNNFPAALIKINKSQNQPVQTVSIEWNAALLKKYYASYNIERSTNGTNYSVINSKPIVYSSQYDSTGASANSIQSFYYTDTLPNITRKYYYRIVGKSYFNDTQQFQPQEVLIKKFYLIRPSIDSVKSISSVQNRLYWKFPDEQNNIVMDSVLKNNPYILMVSQNGQQYKALVTNIPKNIRTFAFNKSLLTSSNIDTTKTFFYQLGAVTVTNDTLSSIAYMVMGVDKTPPAVPSDMKTELISKGSGKAIVRTTWSSGNEPDLLGYILKRRIGETDSLYVISNLKFQKQNDSLTTRVIQTMADDTLSLKIEDYPKIYYFLYAVDENYNISQPIIREFTALKDETRPLAPFLRKIYKDGSNVKVSITFSPERGTTHILRRKQGPNGSWVDIKTYTETQRDTLFTDNGATAQDEYYYSIIAKDKTGNESCFKENNSNFLNDYSDNNCIQIIKIDLRGTPIKPVTIQNFTAVSNVNENIIELEWSLNSSYTTTVKEFEIYKAEYLPTADSTEQKEFLWKIVPYYLDSNNSLIKFVDNYPEKQKVNKYMIRSILADGTISDWRSAQLLY